MNSTAFNDQVSCPSSELARFSQWRALLEDFTAKLGINPPTIAKPLARYSHGALQGPGFSPREQLGAHPDGSIPEDVEAQCVLCFGNQEPSSRTPA